MLNLIKSAALAALVLSTSASAGLLMSDRAASTSSTPVSSAQRDGLLMSD